MSQKGENDNFLLPIQVNEFLLIQLKVEKRKEVECVHFVFERNQEGEMDN